MEYRPSKFALFLTRLMNYISGFLFVWGLTSVCKYLLPGGAAFVTSFILWSFFALGVLRAAYYGIKTAWINHRYIRIEPRTRTLFWSFWQTQYATRAYAFGFSEKQEWTPCIAFAWTYPLFLAMLLFNHWRMPELVPMNGWLFFLPAIIACFVSSFVFVFACTGFGHRPEPPSSGPTGPSTPDDYGPAGMGARLRRPTPVLDATERKRA